jgi:hypothetical protein
MDHGACRLLLLVSGEIVYLGDAQKAVPYFESLGFRSAPHENPADFLGTAAERFSYIVPGRLCHRFNNMFWDCTTRRQQLYLCAAELLVLQKATYAGYSFSQ